MRPNIHFTSLFPNQYPFLPRPSNSRLPVWVATNGLKRVCRNWIIHVFSRLSEVSTLQCAYVHRSLKGIDGMTVGRFKPVVTMRKAKGVKEVKLYLSAASCTSVSRHTLRFQRLFLCLEVEGWVYLPSVLFSSFLRTSENASSAIITSIFFNRKKNGRRRRRRRETGKMSRSWRRHPHLHHS